MPDTDTNIVCCAENNGEEMIYARAPNDHSITKAQCKNYTKLWRFSNIIEPAY